MDDFDIFEKGQVRYTTDKSLGSFLHISRQFIAVMRWVNYT